MTLDIFSIDRCRSVVNAEAYQIGRKASEDEERRVLPTGQPRLSKG